MEHIVIIIIMLYKIEAKTLLLVVKLKIFGSSNTFIAKELE